MTSRKESLEVTSIPHLGLRKPSISTLDKFKSPSPLPASHGLLSGQQTILNELTKSIETDGTKVAISYCKWVERTLLTACAVFIHNSSVL